MDEAAKFPRTIAYGYDSVGNPCAACLDELPPTAFDGHLRKLCDQHGWNVCVLAHPAHRQAVAGLESASLTRSQEISFPNVSQEVFDLCESVAQMSVDFGHEDRLVGLMGRRRNIIALAEDKTRGALLGLAVGDALGSTIEFSKRDSQPKVTDMIGGGPFGLKPGEWTDDTSMAHCLADSLVAMGGFDSRDILARFVRWWRNGENSVTGDCFDIGATTRRSLELFTSDGRLLAGPEDPLQGGNGSLMRLAPVAIFSCDDIDQAEEIAKLQSQTTHPASVAHDACRLFARMLVEAIEGGSKNEVLRGRAWDGSPEITQIAGGGWRRKVRDEISSSGYVVHTLEAAMWCVPHLRSGGSSKLACEASCSDKTCVASRRGRSLGSAAPSTRGKRSRASYSRPDSPGVYRCPFSGPCTHQRGCNGLRVSSECNPRTDLYLY